MTRLSLKLGDKRFAGIHLSVIIVSLLIAGRWGDGGSWAIDQAVTYRQARHFLETGAYPAYGLINSQGFRNPNALALLTTPFAALFKNPMHLSVALYLFHVLLMLWCYRRLVFMFNPTILPAVYLAGIPVLIWLPGFFFGAADLWAQSQCQVLLCVLLVLMVTAPDRPKPWIDFTIGSLFIFLPALHLSLVTLLPAGGFYLLLFRRRHAPWWLGAGAVFIILLVWLPWGRFLLTEAHSPGARLGFPKAVETNVVLYGFSAAYQLGRLLVSRLDVPHARLGIAGETTLAWLTAIGCLRGAIFGAGLAAMVAGFGKSSLRKASAAFAWSVGGILLIFSLLGFAGWPPYSGRTDIGAMFLPVLLLIATAMIAAHPYPPSRKINSFFVIVAGAVTLLSITAVRSCYHDVFRRGDFTLYDIPISEKIAAVKRLFTASGSMTRVTVNYSVRDYYKRYDWVPKFNALDPQHYYRPESLLEGYIESIAPNRFQFVDSTASPVFIIANPVSSHETWNRPSVRGSIRYRALFRGRYLELWGRAPIVPIMGMDH